MTRLKPIRFARYGNSGIKIRFRYLFDHWKVSVYFINEWQSCLIHMHDRYIKILTQNRPDILFYAVLMPFPIAHFDHVFNPKSSFIANKCGIISRPKLARESKGFDEGWNFYRNRYKLIWKKTKNIRLWVLWNLNRKNCRWKKKPVLFNVTVEIRIRTSIIIIILCTKCISRKKNV